MNSVIRERVKRVEDAIDTIIADEQFSNCSELAQYVIEDYSRENILDRSIFNDRPTRKLYIGLCEAVQAAISIDKGMKNRSMNAIVLVDMDNVLVDYESTTHHKVLKAYPDIKLQPGSEAPYIEDLTNNSIDRQRVLDVQYEQGHFLSMPPIPGAINGWKKIKDLGYYPRIASAPLTRNHWCIQEKLQWIDEYLGPEAVDDARIASDKSQHQGIALIDDMPEVRGAEKAIWKHIVFDQPYNQGSSSEYRLRGWEDAKLSKYLASCANRYDTLTRR